MPISPETRHLYPKDWPQIRARILERDGHRCRVCQAPDRTLIVRSTEEEHPGWYAVDPLQAEVLGLDGIKVIYIVLTVAHLNHHPEDCRPENLAALCQKHHLAWDAEIHRKHRALTRRHKIAEAGQGELAL